MTVKNVLQGECEAIRTGCVPICQFDDQLDELFRDLTDTMRAEHVLSLSAPQIGKPVQAIVVDIGQSVLELVNPLIECSSGTQSSVESCASFPDTAFKIVRPDGLTVTAQDRRGDRVRIEATGLLARLLAHELDHLQGILFYDHLEEEDWLLQMIGQQGIQTDDEEPVEDDDTATESSRAESAQLVRQAVDMLADAAWKMVLASELLDIPVLSQDMERKRMKLQTTARRLQDEADEWEHLLLPEDFTE